MSSVLYCALNITPHKFPKAGGGHGGRAQRLPPKEHRKNSVLVLIRFLSASFPLCHVIVVLVVVLPSSSLLLSLVSSVFVLSAFNINYPT